MITGVKIQNGTIIIRARAALTIPAERFLDFVFLCNKAYTGPNMNARSIPIIMDIKIGLTRRKERTMSTISKIEVITLLKYASSIILGG